MSFSGSVGTPGELSAPLVEFVCGAGLFPPVARTQAASANLSGMGSGAGHNCWRNPGSRLYHAKYQPVSN